jgi:hypothetical protein
MIYNLTNINGLFRDDVKEILQSLGITNAKILMLQQEQIGSEFDRICQWNRYLEGLSEDTVVLTTAYISTDLYPESEWRLPGDCDEADNRKVIPVGSVLEKEAELLEAVKFVNVNDFVRYEYKEAYVWPNNIGKRVVECMQRLVSRK